MEKVKVEVIKYKAKDGRIFDEEKSCIHHEKMLSGERKTCQSCGGRGEVPDGFGVRNIKCGTCSGKGWVEKFEVWR